MNLISLVGHQPIPILIPALHLQPEANTLVYTKDTQSVADRLSSLLENCSLVRVDPYRYDSTEEQLSDHIPLDGACTFNVTGGTKLMALAAYSLASEHQHPIIYLNSQFRRNVLYSFSFQDGTFSRKDRETIDELLNIDQYLRAHLPGYDVEGPHKEDGRISYGGEFEKAIRDVLDNAPEIDEVMVGVRPHGVAENIEIDLVVRVKNQVGIIEAKTGGDHPKQGIDQLTTLSRRYLGTYTHKFYIMASPPKDSRYKAVAAKNDIHVLELKSYREGQFRKQDRLRLVRRVKEKMSPPRR